MRKNTIIGVAVLSLAGCSRMGEKVDSYEPKGNPSYQMAENLACRIEASSHKADVGQTISLLALASEKPKVLFSGTGLTSPMQKLFESDETLVVQVVASASGSTDTIVLNKKSGTFARSTAGNFVGVYASAEVGSCK
jgi:hypothetical protein